MLPILFLHFSQAFFGFGTSVELEIVLNDQDTRKTAEVKLEDGRKEQCYLYLDGETISGKVCSAQLSVNIMYISIYFHSIQ